MDAQNVSPQVTPLTPEHPTSPSGLRGAPAIQNDLTSEQKMDIEKNKDVAAMSYLWILSVVVLYARRESPFIEYHARQGLWLFLVSIPVWLIPVAGQYLEFFVLAAMIIGFINAAQGRIHDLPVIGQLAKGTITLRDLWKRAVTAILHGANVLKRGLRQEKASQENPPPTEKNNTPNEGDQG